jgi:hypothetical protein
MKPNNPSHLFNNNRRFCSNHMGDAPVAGGKWLISGSKRTHRWLCAACLERRLLRQKAKLQQVPA